jgi:hypothetical protein
MHSITWAASGPLPSPTTPLSFKKMSTNISAVFLDGNKAAFIDFRL